LLRALELQRQHHHEQQARPIRYVHVAWGILQVDGKILLRSREDKRRPGMKNFVLVGGRMSQEDLRAVGVQDSLRVLQSAAGSDHTKGIECALRREICEETGLLERQHYSYQLLRSLAPYREVEGAGANHAYTEYRIHLYVLALTR